MTDWLDDYAAALDVPSDMDEDALLGLARIVAHGTERKNAPLATYLAGRYVERAITRGHDPQSAREEAIARARSLLEDG